MSVSAERLIVSSRYFLFVSFFFFSRVKKVDCNRMTINAGSFVAQNNVEPFTPPSAWSGNCRS